MSIQIRKKFINLTLLRNKENADKQNKSLYPHFCSTRNKAESQ